MSELHEAACLADVGDVADEECIRSDSKLWPKLKQFVA